ncbi:MAG: hypothetical protein GEU99_12220 [Luteitalea sp.]|nr:hypothetical protein [Luteitalea sp.]
MRSRLASLAIFWCVALAAWLLQGDMAPIDAAADSARVGILPSAWWLAGGLVAASVIGAWARAAVARVLPLALTVLLVVPWLPLATPRALLALVGPAAGVAATAILCLWMAGCLPAPSRMPASLSEPRRATIIAGSVAAVLFGLAAWRVAPMLPGGDEPHYLVATQSLLYDGDLKVENNYRQRDYRQFITAELRPNFMRRGQDGAIYSIHLPGVSVLVLPAFAIGGHSGVVVFLVLLAALGMALVWRVSWEVTQNVPASWFAWAGATSSAPVVFQAATVGPDGPAGVLVLAGVWALLRASERSGERDEGDGMTPWLGAGAALAMLPWLHSRLAVLAGVLGVLLVWQLLRRSGGIRRTAAFLLVPAASAAGWFTYFWSIYGEWSPGAPYRGSNLDAAAHVPSGIGGLFFDHQFGLVPNAPIFLISLIGVGVMLCGHGWRRTRAGIWLAVGVTALIATYVLAVSPMRMWWAGWSAPARFAAPFLPALAVAAAAAWQSARLRVTHATMLLALGTSAGITALLVIVQRGRLAYNVRDAWGRLFEWLSPLVALPGAMPSFHRVPEHHGFYHAAIWLAALLAAWLVLRRLEQRLVGAVKAAPCQRVWSRAVLATVVPFAFCLAAMLAMSAVWMLVGATVLRPAPAQLRVLRRIEPGTREVALRLAPFQLLSPAAVAALLRIRTSERWLAERDRPLFILPGGIPAGTYSLRVRSDASSAARIVVGIGREMFPIAARVLPAAGGDTVLPLDFPVDVRAIVVRGNAEAAATIRDMVVEPVAVRAGRRRGGHQARQAVRYRGGTSYFLDDRALVDVAGFWVPGGQAAEVVVVPRRPRRVARLALRNVPVENHVALRCGRWALDLDLAPEESREVDVPILPRSGPPSVITIGATAGFRRADVDPSSQDRRWLGLRVALP